MTIALDVHPDAESAARAVGLLAVERARARDASFTLALSRVRPALLDVLAGGLPWGRAVVFQVDERVAPVGSDERNATALLAALPAERLLPMPVDQPDLDRAAAHYEAALPQRLDLVHLGLGTDGHTASLVPGDQVLDVRDRLVAVTGAYEGHRRMTLTYPALDAARELVWLVTGEEKQDALRRLLARDPSIPAGRIDNPAQLVVADERAVPR